MSSLFKVLEFSDLYVDACLRNNEGAFVFLSVYGRDTSIQQFKAAMQLKTGNGGITSFHLQADGERTAHAVQVGSLDDLETFSGRFPKDNLFGNLTHNWIYDPALLKPCKTNRTGWVLLDQPWSDSTEKTLLSGIWGLYKTLSPVPLLDEWKDTLLTELAPLHVTWMSGGVFRPLGRISAARLRLDADFSEVISEMVKMGKIGIDAETWQAQQQWQASIEQEAYQVGCEILQASARMSLRQAKEIVIPFLSYSQFKVMEQCCKGEEGDYFKQLFASLAERISSMPKTYDTQNQADPLVYLHYFLGGSDWYITEKDMDGGVDQAFGYAVLNQDIYSAELGYISIQELVQYGVELDLYFDPVPLSCIRDLLKKRA